MSTKTSWKTSAQNPSPTLIQGNSPSDEKLIYDSSYTSSYAVDLLSQSPERS